MTDVTHLPTPGVILDLDAEVRDEKDIVAPFVTKIGDRLITFADPGELDWRDLAAVQHPADLIRISLNIEDRNHLNKLDLPTWKFSKLMEAYYAHYDLESKIQAAKRQQALGGL